MVEVGENESNDTEGSSRVTWEAYAWLEHFGEGNIWHAWMAGSINIISEATMLWFNNFSCTNMQWLLGSNVPFLVIKHHRYKQNIIFDKM